MLSSLHIASTDIHLLVEAHVQCRGHVGQHSHVGLQWVRLQEGQAAVQHLWVRILLRAEGLDGQDPAGDSSKTGCESAASRLPLTDSMQHTDYKAISSCTYSIRHNN